MKVPVQLSEAFGAEFENLIAQFAWERQLLPDPESISSPRFLSRSLIPHIRKLSALFNRLEEVPEVESEFKKKGIPKGRRKKAFIKADETSAAHSLDPYWKESSNPAHLRLAYFLYFMPCNLYRVASVWSELARLGFRWPFQGGFKGIEFGAGPASGACGIAAGEHFGKIGIPAQGDWALIEQDKGVLQLGAEWAATYFGYLGFKDWGTRLFHRKIDLERGFLPRSAPKFHLWLMSYYLNELETPTEELAKQLLDSWDRHLEEEGIVILVEPALRSQSRKLLGLRKAILEEQERRKKSVVQVLLPCLGHQSCGALADAEDWCHEEVMWWRPPYFRVIDRLAELDRKTLPFSYLVLAKSQKPREEILPGLAGTSADTRHRLVSPAHGVGKDLDFFLCGTEGKRRSRYRPLGKTDPGADLERGDILLNAELRGDPNSTKVGKLGRKV